MYHRVINCNDRVGEDFWSLLGHYAGISFLAHLSRRLKWAFLITICPLSFVVVVVVVNYSHFLLLLQNHWTNFTKTWYKASLGDTNSILFK